MLSYPLTNFEVQKYYQGDTKFKGINILTKMKDRGDTYKSSWLKTNRNSLNKITSEWC